jgi:riboflavin synthase alpha subunit
MLTTAPIRITIKVWHIYIRGHIANDCSIAATNTHSGALLFPQQFIYDEQVCWYVATRGSIARQGVCAKV